MLWSVNVDAKPCGMHVEVEDIAEGAVLRANPLTDVLASQGFP
jgi:hypothetical protein